MEFKDYYQILGVPRNATQDEIKRAHRLLARKYHPDVTKESDGEARFKEVSEAYEVLKDSQKRSAYDQLGADWNQGQDFRPPPDWQAGFDSSGGGFTGGDPSHFSDFFESLFGNRLRGSGAGQGGAVHAHGRDHHARVAIDLEDAFRGSTQLLTFQTSGMDDRGSIVPREQKLNVTIPKGIRAGQQVRLKGQGGTALGKGIPGDLYLEVSFRPHPRFRVEGSNVFTDLPLSPWEAALGTSVNVPTPAGAIELKVPPDSVAGSKMRVKGGGIPGKPPGDLFVVLQVLLPTASGEKEKEFYRKMAQEFQSFNPRAK